MADEVNRAATSSDYDAQVDYWNKVEAILKGESAIKAATTKYLPKFANEKQAVYDYRLQVSPFTNIYADISQNLSSKPFSKDLTLKEGTPDQYVKLSENIDGQGNNLHVFASNSFKAALDKGIDWILVEFTKVRPRADGKPLTLSDERAQALRPYWVHVPAENMLAVYSAFVGSVEVIYHARIRELSKEVDPVTFNETTVERIRHLSRERIVDDLGQTVAFGPATFTLWQQRLNTEQKSVWTQVDAGPISIGIIPLVPVILTKRDGGSWIVKSAISGLADMQVTEYRQESNLEWVKVMTVFPMICVSGMAATGPDGKPVEVTVGPNTVFLIPQNSAGTGPAGTVSVVETSGSSSAELRNQLELFRKEMRDIGMQPLAVANLTVTLSNHVTKKASSAVQAWAFLFKDALELALKYTAMWLGDKAEPEVVIHTDFAVEMEQGNVLDSLLKAEAQSVFSKETVRAEFKRRNAVSNDVSEDDEQERLAEEQDSLAPEQPIDPVTGQPIVMPDPNMPAPPNDQPPNGTSLQ